MTTAEPHPPLALTTPFSSASTTFTTTSTTTTTSSSTNITKSQSSIGLHTPALQKINTNNHNDEDEDDDTPTQLHRITSDGRRNSFGQPLPSPTESWQPTFNRIQSWNREDRKREIVLKSEIKEHEGHGGGFSEKR